MIDCKLTKNTSVVNSTLFVNTQVWSGIDGKCFRFIKNMYKGIKSRVQIGQHVSNLFLCNVGVRQDEN